jgi:hypothetical protein
VTKDCESDLDSVLFEEQEKGRPTPSVRITERVGTRFPELVAAAA